MIVLNFHSYTCLPCLFLSWNTHTSEFWLECCKTFRNWSSKIYPLIYIHSALILPSSLFDLLVCLSIVCTCTGTLHTSIRMYYLAYAVCLDCLECLVASTFDIKSDKIYMYGNDFMHQQQLDTTNTVCMRYTIIVQYVTSSFHLPSSSLVLWYYCRCYCYLCFSQKNKNEMLLQCYQDPESIVLTKKLWMHLQARSIWNEYWVFCELEGSLVVWNMRTYGSILLLFTWTSLRFRSPHWAKTITHISFCFWFACSCFCIQILVPNAILPTVCVLCVVLNLCVPIVTLHNFCCVGCA